MPRVWFCKHCSIVEEDHLSYVQHARSHAERQPRLRTFKRMRSSLEIPESDSPTDIPQYLEDVDEVIKNDILVSMGTDIMFEDLCDRLSDVIPMQLSPFEIEKYFDFDDESTFEINRKPDTLFSCKNCSKMFLKEESLKTHACKEKTENKVSRVKPNNYNCSVCGKAYDQKHNRDVHENTHRFEYACIYCNTKVVLERSMKIHLKKHHPELENHWSVPNFISTTLKKTKAPKGANGKKKTEGSCRRTAPSEMRKYNNKNILKERNGED